MLTAGAPAPLPNYLESRNADMTLHANWIGCGTERHYGRVEYEESSHADDFSGPLLFMPE
jgi:hypothetical protein